MANRVSVNMSYKVNMGNYETLGVEFGVEVDVEPDETTAAAFERAHAFVWKRLNEKVDEARAHAR